MSAMKVDCGPRIGADPEFFLANPDGEVTVSCGKIGGTKETPLDVSKDVADSVGHLISKQDIGGFAVQEDNVAFEFNVPACRDAYTFARNVQYFMAWVQGWLKTKQPKAKLLPFIKPTHQFSAATLDEFPQSRQIGCDPDCNAYSPETGFKREPFNPATLGDFRFCGGHIHLQYNKNNVPPQIMAQFLDVIVTLPYLALDKQGERRKFYGLPGLYREKDYGVEYRTLSNFWLQSRFLEVQLAHMAMSILNLGLLANGRFETLQTAYKIIPWDDVKKAIENEDEKLAEELTIYTRKNTRLMVRG